MKKFSLILTIVLVLSLLCGCAGTTVVYQTNCTCPTGSHDVTVEAAPEATTAPEATPETVPADQIVSGAVKTGLAMVTGIKVEEEKASYDVTFVAVNVDDNGVITACAIDSLGADVATADIAGANGEVKTKQELGYDYNMITYGGAKYEWFEQANFLAEFAVGKTVEELKAGAMGENADVDLVSCATIYLGGYVSAIEKAVANAQHLGAMAGDELKLASVNSLKEGSLNSDAVALTMKDGVITSCYLDSLQASLSVAEDGTISAGNTMTKNELGYDYNMITYGGAKFEWFEQAANFAAYITGKTVADVSGIAVNESTYPTDADLTATCTIAIGGFQALIAKAAQ